MLTAVGQGARLHRGAQAVSLPGLPVGLAADATRVVVSTSAGLHVLGDGLVEVASAPAGDGGPAVAGDLAFQESRSVRLDDGSVAPTPAAPADPVLARGFVISGPLALETTDLTPPAITPGRGLVATVADDRGVAAVRFIVSGRTMRATTDGTPWAPARYVASPPTVLAPGPHPVRIRATDLAGNASSATSRLRVSCQHRRRGGRRSDHLRGGPGRDCIDARGGNDVVVVTGGGADRVRCGPGRDTVRADRSDRVARDCERTPRRAGR